MLLQKIRAEQALKEINLTGIITINHEKPETIINNKQYTLVFPKSLLNFNTNIKKIDQLFIGKITKSRQSFLNNFPNAKVIHSLNGRVEDKKVYDTNYFKQMSLAKFVLCPNGAFIWTYRFFESIIFKSIPIIEDFCDIYDGYYFYKLGDSYRYNTELVDYNLKKLKKEMMFNSGNLPL